MFNAVDGTIDNQTSDWVLTNNNGSIGWYKLPVNAFKNDNTNTTYSLAGALSGNNYIATLTDSNSNKTTATVPVMTGASSSTAGKAGLVPAPGTANAGQYLKGDGTWSIVNKAQTLSSDGITSSVFALPYYSYTALNTEFETTGSNTQQYLKNYLKKLIKSHNSLYGKVGVGTLSPNSQYTTLFRAYYLENHTNGLPQHASGFSIDVDGSGYTWGTYDGNWYFKKLAFTSDLTDFVTSNSLTTTLNNYLNKYNYNLAANSSVKIKLVGHTHLTLFTRKSLGGYEGIFHITSYGVNSNNAERTSIT